MEGGWFNLFLSSLVPPFCLMSDRHKEMSRLIKIRFSHHTRCAAAASAELTQEMRRSNTSNSGWLRMILELRGSGAHLAHSKGPGLLSAVQTFILRGHIITRELFLLGNWIELHKLFKRIDSICGPCGNACNAGQFLWCTWLGRSLKKQFAQKNKMKISVTCCSKFACCYFFHCYTTSQWPQPIVLNIKINSHEMQRFVKVD